MVACHKKIPVGRCHRSDFHLDTDLGEIRLTISINPCPNRLNHDIGLESVCMSGFRQKFFAAADYTHIHLSNPAASLRNEIPSPPCTRG